ncbi:MAG: HEAT repeat domain-containing protein [Dokdonella sp.]
MTRTYATVLAMAMALALALDANAAHAASDGDMAPADKASNQLYWQGQAALKKSDWSGALKRFEELERLLRDKEPKSADAALYWEAYALVQAKRGVEAKNVLERLHREFPDSRWSRDAEALLQQARPAAAKVDADAMKDDELAGLAVEGLLNAPPERALPILKKVLQSQRSVEIKKRALFVLSQLGSDEAMDVVIDTTKNSSDPDMRDEAIRMLGISGEARAIERLREVYATSKDAHEKDRIIEAWLVADRKDLVLASARTESDESVRRKAIQTLGALDASDELRQLFDATQDSGSRRAIIESLGVAGNADALAAIAANAKLSEDIRIAALHSLGVAGDRGGEQALVQIYAKADTPALRDATLQGLLITGDSDAVLDLYRNAKSVEEKKALLRTLMQMGDDTAIDAIEAELDKPEKKP